MAVFALCHRLGLAAKLQDFALPQTNLWKNLLAFDVGVEIAHLVALFFLAIAEPVQDLTNSNIKTTENTSCEL
ncbi:MAG: hypothetical protein HOO87_03630 [Methyloglobulus sp.]|nr:hypothetical protein [Methyloglobulus sp.]